MTFLSSFSSIYKECQIKSQLIQVIRAIKTTTPNLTSPTNLLKNTLSPKTKKNIIADYLPSASVLNTPSAVLRHSVSSLTGSAIPAHPTPQNSPSQQVSPISSQGS